MGSIILTGPVLVTAPGDANTRHSTAVVSVGSKGFSEDGEFVFVGSAAGTVNSGEPVSANGALSNVKRGDLDVGGFLGIAEAPFASGEYGYVRQSGPCSAYVASGVAAGGYLELSGTVGQLKALTSSGQSVGIALEASPNADGLTSIYLTK